MQLGPLMSWMTLIFFGNVVRASIYTLSIILIREAVRIWDAILHLKHLNKDKLMQQKLDIFKWKVL